MEFEKIKVANPIVEMDGKCWNIQLTDCDYEKRLLLDVMVSVPKF